MCKHLSPWIVSVRNTFNAEFGHVNLTKIKSNASHHIKACAPLEKDLTNWFLFKNSNSTVFRKVMVL